MGDLGHGNHFQSLSILVQETKRGRVKREIGNVRGVPSAMSQRMSVIYCAAARRYTAPTRPCSQVKYNYRTSSARTNKDTAQGSITAALIHCTLLSTLKTSSVYPDHVKITILFEKLHRPWFLGESSGFLLFLLSRQPIHNSLVSFFIVRFFSWV